MSKSRRVSAASQAAAKLPEVQTPQAPAPSEKTRPQDVEVLPKAKRRTFTAAYKAQILAEAGACGPGEVGALLRREGLYSSNLSKWRDQRARGEAAGLQPKKRGRKPNVNKQLQDENKRLRRQNQRLEEDLHKAQVVVDVQKKVAMLLGVPMEASKSEKPS